jgi:hypothetical protein
MPLHLRDRIARMPSLIDGIIRRKARIMARTHIKHALNALRTGEQFSFNDCQHEINHSYWYRKSVDFVFEKAYENPWYILGREDALKGRRQFDLPQYVAGWRNQILSLSFDGWVNPRIIQQYGWIDEAIEQQYNNTKHEIDRLAWGGRRREPVDN